MKKIAIYARYSSDLQDESSVEDQFLVCRERANKEGWQVVQTYCDHAVSGASLMRGGIQHLMQDASEGKFDIILSEALDRFSRDQEDIAHLFKRFSFVDAKMFTLSEGEITSMHIGLKGTMNSMFLEELRNKTRRGIRGRVEKGKSGGGKTYGYDIIKEVDEKGEYKTGERAVNPQQAGIVRRIFKEYQSGKSPRSIAKQLNKEGIEGPSGNAWGPSTINGNRRRGTGIVNNQLYIGKLVWNRLRYIKDPETGKRVSRINPESEWIIKDVPELRIVSDDDWNKAKAMQNELDALSNKPGKKLRATHLLSGLVKCGSCGGGCSMLNATHLGCSTARNKGTCDNRKMIKREKLEQAVLGSLSEHLMDEKLCAEFCTEYTRRINELRKQKNASLAAYKAEHTKLSKQMDSCVQAILDGFANEELKQKMNAIEARKKELSQILENQDEEKLLFHPNMSDLYHKEIRNLISSLNESDSKAEASKILRGLIDQVVLTAVAGEDELAVDLIGDLAGILSIATRRDRSVIERDLSEHQPVHDVEKPRDSGKYMALVAGGHNTHDLRDQGKYMALVAGAGFEPATFRL